jgi:hypothetical protein
MRIVTAATDRRGQIKNNVIYNAAIVRDPVLSCLSRRIGWSSGVTETVGGRGSVLFIRDGERHWVASLQRAA